VFGVEHVIGCIPSASTNEPLFVPGEDPEVNSIGLNCESVWVPSEEDTDFIPVFNTLSRLQPSTAYPYPNLAISLGEGLPLGFESALLENIYFQQAVNILMLSSDSLSHRTAYPSLYLNRLIFLIFLF
jgi:hypothetical protein